MAEWESPVDALYRDFGRRLRTAREAGGLSQSELAARVGLGRTSITNIETGRQRVPLHLLLELAAALGVQPASLLPTPPFDGQPTLPPSAARAMSTLTEEQGDWVRRVIRTHTISEEPSEES